MHLFILKTFLSALQRNTKQIHKDFQFKPYLDKTEKITTIFENNTSFGAMPTTQKGT